MKKLINRLVLASVMCGLTGVAFADPPKSYTKKCATCHGKDGKAQTKMGKKLSVRDLTDPKVQETFSDDQAFKHLSDGMKAKDGTDLMDPFKGELSPEEIKALVDFVRTLKAS